MDSRGTVAQNTNDLGIEIAGVYIRCPQLHRGRRSTQGQCYTMGFERWATATVQSAAIHTSYNAYAIVTANLSDDESR